MKFRLYTALLLLTSSFGAIAQQQPETGGSRLDAAEQEFMNGDVKETQRIIFEQLDINGNEAISETEARQNESLLLSFERLDQDGNGLLTLDEFNDWKAFDKADRGAGSY